MAAADLEDTWRDLPSMKHRLKTLMSSAYLAPPNGFRRTICGIIYATNDLVRKSGLLHKNDFPLLERVVIMAREAIY